MKVLSLPQWGATTIVSTIPPPPSAQFSAPQDAPFCGICFGPDSEEGHVLVNGYSLMAGHVLPLADTAYQITGVMPAWPSFLAGGPLLGVNLQLWGLQSAEEVIAAADLIRAKKSYGALGLVGPTGSNATMMNVPFSGRYRCLFTINTPDTTPNNLRYQVQGNRYEPMTNSFVKCILTQQLNVGVDFNGTAAFYVEDESWDWLSIGVGFMATPTSTTINLGALVTAEIQP
jgi:hypothetical protein